MPNPRRRLSVRKHLDRPLEAALRLCGGDPIQGWIVDEQDDGIGMAFGAADAEQVLGHCECCLHQAADLWLDGEGPDEARAVPMRMAHVTRQAEGTAKVGLQFDVPRMQPEDIVHLLGVWRRLVVG